MTTPILVALQGPDPEGIWGAREIGATGLLASGGAIAPAALRHRARRPARLIGDPTRSGRPLDQPSPPPRWSKRQSPASRAAA